MNLIPSSTSLFTYFSLGLIGSLAYTTRFLIQWIRSEIKKESHVTQIFWQISLVGYFVMVIHFFIQHQYNFCIAQACNAVISWRNLDLMRTPLKKRYELKHVIFAFIGVVSFITFLFILRDFLHENGSSWFRSPFKTGHELSLVWHIIGSIGIICFASRFWVQWWIAEKNKKSDLGVPFWYLSIIGGITTLVYAINLRDIVIIANYSCGLIPYTRNLILISNKRARDRKKAKKAKESHEQ